MPDWRDCDAVERNPSRVSGAWVFKNTRVPVRALFANIESGATIAEFVEWFPGVTRSQAETVLEHRERCTFPHGSCRRANLKIGHSSSYTGGSISPLDLGDADKCP